MTFIPGTSGFPIFTDNFNAADLADPWLKLGLSGSDKTLILSGGRAVLTGNAGQDCSAYAPRMTMPLPYMPCDIETKLSAANLGPRTLEGLYIGPDGQAAGASVYDIFIDQCNDNSDNTIRVEGNSGLYAGPTIQATIPKWFKIRCMGSHLGAQWIFYYSLNGSSWTTYFARTLPAALGPLCVGLFIGNWYNQPAVNASFEYFTINPVNQLGPG